MPATSIDQMMTRPISLRDLAGAAGDLLGQAPDGDAEVTGLAYDSRHVSRGDLFFCIPGTRSDGHLFAAPAAAAGAVALCVEKPVEVPVPQVLVRDARKAMARVAARFYGDPAERLSLLGITGTNGKTTTAYLVESILRASGATTGLIGTVETRVGALARAGVRTTPESVDLQRLFADMVDEGVDAVAMEVTSHGLALDRVEGIRFAAAAFTNLSQDHLDFHSDMEDYFGAKKSLFVPERTATGAVNVDDPYGRRLLAEASVPCLSFGHDATADVRAEDVSLAADRTSFRIVAPGGQLDVETALVGSFNVYNCLAAAAIALQAGVEGAAIEEGIKAVRAVPGRFESVPTGRPFTVVVDYAHTPDSLDNVLRAARSVTRRSGGRVIAVFGCGGDRDRGKRPLMGAVAARLADVTVVTSDNPRSEDPIAIIDAILEGVVAERPDGADYVLPDREEAIQRAVDAATDGDVIVIAGKGHETGQEFADRTIPFDDRDVARRALGRTDPKARP